jgi:hypothetical protein
MAWLTFLPPIICTALIVISLILSFIFLTQENALR